MKVELHIEGAHVSAWFAGAVAGYAAAREADDAVWLAKRDMALGPVAAGDPVPASEEPAEAAPAKRARKAKAEEPAQITVSPEDRKPTEEIEDAEIVDIFEDDAPMRVYTRDDVKAAMNAYIAKHGMDSLVANASTLIGAPKLSAVPEDPSAFAAAVARLEAATND